MLNYRLTAPLLPVFLLLLLPALAAYPWEMPFGASLALPFLTLLVILFCSLRYPGVLISPIVFVSGLACDLFTRSPPGYWTFLFLVTLSCARGTMIIVQTYGRLAGWLCFFATIVFLTLLAWGLASFYQFEWQTPQASLRGMMMALVLLPLPLLLLTGFEKLLILHKDDPSSGFGVAR